MELGVADELREIEGVTTAMMVKLGENDVKTIEDLAGCATDDLVGWTEKRNGETVKETGYLDGVDISRDEAEAIVMRARVKVGWVQEEDLQAAPAEDLQAALVEDLQAEPAENELAHGESVSEA